MVYILSEQKYHILSSKLIHITKHCILTGKKEVEKIVNRTFIGKSFPFSRMRVRNGTTKDMFTYDTKKRDYYVHVTS